MDASDPGASRFKPPFELHETTGVTGYDGIDSQGFQFIDLVIGHAHRDARQTDAEGAAESTAAFARRRLDEFQTVDRFEQSSGPALDSQFSKPVACIVPGDPTRPGCAEFDAIQSADEEVAQFERGLRDAFGRDRIFAIQKFDRVPEHRGARPGRGHDRIAATSSELVVEDSDGPFADRNGVLMKAGIEGGLAAAGLPRVEDHLASALFEHRDRGLCRIGAKLVHEAGDEESDSHAEEDTPSIPDASASISRNFERSAVL